MRTPSSRLNGFARDQEQNTSDCALRVHRRNEKQQQTEHKPRYGEQKLLKVEQRQVKAER